MRLLIDKKGAIYKRKDIHDKYLSNMSKEGKWALVRSNPGFFRIGASLTQIKLVLEEVK